MIRTDAEVTTREEVGQYPALMHDKKTGDIWLVLEPLGRGLLRSPAVLLVTARQDAALATVAEVNTGDLELFDNEVRIRNV